MKLVIFRYLMLGVTRVCTVTTDQLMDAIAMVESNRGATSANVYQLKPIYVEDVNRITGQGLTHGQAVADDAVARACIEAYWEYYGARYYRLTRRQADAEVLARIHNGGPDGWRKPSTRAYWTRVKSALILNALRVNAAGGVL